MYGIDAPDIHVEARDILLGAVILLIGAVVAAHRPVSQEIARYPMEVHITETAPDKIAVGISAEDGAIDFGDLPTGATHAAKTINITNNADQAVTATTHATGNISRYIQLKSDRLSISPGSTQAATVRIQTTNVTTIGYHTGALVVTETQPYWRWLWEQ